MGRSVEVDHGQGAVIQQAGGLGGDAQGAGHQHWRLVIDGLQIWIKFIIFVVQVNFNGTKYDMLLSFCGRKAISDKVNRVERVSCLLINKDDGQTPIACNTYIHIFSIYLHKQ